MFKFTICELILLTVIAALGVCWWLEHRRSVADRNNLKELVNRAKEGEWYYPSSPTAKDRDVSASSRTKTRWRNN
jgi:hypothetical protein